MVSIFIKQLHAQTKRLIHALLEEIKVDFRASASTVAPEATFLNSQTSQLIFKSLKMKNPVMHWQYLMELQNWKKYVLYSGWGNVSLIY